MKTLVFVLLMVVTAAVAHPHFFYPQQATSTYAHVPQPAVATYTDPLIYSTQYHAQDTLGSYRFGYSSSDGQEKVEAKDYDGRVAGKFSYTDPEGDEVELKYVADKDGFRAEGDHLPKSPEQPEQPDFLKKAYKEAEDRLEQARIQSVSADTSQYIDQQRVAIPAVATYGGFKSVSSTSSFVPVPAPAPKVTSTSYTTTYSRPATITYVRPEATTYIRPAEPTTYVRPQTTFSSAPIAPIAPAAQTVYTTYTAVRPSTTYVHHPQFPSSAPGKSADTQHSHYHRHNFGILGGAVTQPATIITLPTSTAPPTPAPAPAPTTKPAPEVNPVVVLPAPVVSFPHGSVYPGKSAGTYVYRY